MAAPRHVTKMAANSFATSRMAPQAKRSPGAARRPSPASNPAMSRTPPRRPAAPGRGWPSSITSPGCHTLRQHHGTTPPTSPGYRPSRRSPRGGGAATGAPAPMQAVQRVVRASRIAAQNKLAEQVGGPRRRTPLENRDRAAGRRARQRAADVAHQKTRRRRYGSCAGGRRWRAARADPQHRGAGVPISEPRPCRAPQRRVHGGVPTTSPQQHPAPVT